MRGERTSAILKGMLRFEGTSKTKKCGGFTVRKGAATGKRKRPMVTQRGISRRDRPVAYNEENGAKAQFDLLSLVS